MIKFSHVLLPLKANRYFYARRHYLLICHIRTLINDVIKVADMGDNTATAVGEELGRLIYLFFCRIQEKQRDFKNNNQLFKVFSR